MDVIASTAFGLKVDSQKDKNNQFVTMAKKMFNIGLANPYFIIASKYTGTDTITIYIKFIRIFFTKNLFSLTFFNQFSISYQLCFAVFFPFLMPIVDKLKISLWPKDVRDFFVEATTRAIEAKKEFGQVNKLLLLTLYCKHGCF